MANRTIFIGRGEKLSQASVAIPDKHPSESDSAYESRVKGYLNTRFGTEGWQAEHHTGAATLDADALLIARAYLRQRGTDSRADLLSQLNHRGRVKKISIPNSPNQLPATMITYERGSESF